MLQRRHVPRDVTTLPSPTTRARAGNNTVAQSDKSFAIELRSAADPSTLAAAFATLADSLYTATLQAKRAGSATLAVLYQGSYLPGYPQTLVVKPGALATAKSVLRALPASVTAGSAFSVVLEGRDAYNNLVRTMQMQKLCNQTLVRQATFVTNACLVHPSWA
jgi:hypothetical protein